MSQDFKSSTFSFVYELKKNSKTIDCMSFMYYNYNYCSFNI